MRRMALLATIAGVLLVLTAITGCGGGSGTPVLPANTGIVAGQIFDFTTDRPLGGVKVTVRYTDIVNGRQQTVEKSAQSDANGNFRVTGVTEGRDRQILFTPPEWLSVPPSSPVYVDVIAGQTTTLPSPVRLIPADELPPARPSL